MTYYVTGSLIFVTEGQLSIIAGGSIKCSNAKKPLHPRHHAGDLVGRRGLSPSKGVEVAIGLLHSSLAILLVQTEEVPDMEFKGHAAGLCWSHPILPWFLPPPPSSQSGTPSLLPRNHKMPPSSPPYCRCSLGVPSACAPCYAVAVNVLYSIKLWC